MTSVQHKDARDDLRWEIKLQEPRSRDVVRIHSYCLPVLAYNDAFRRRTVWSIASLPAHDLLHIIKANLVRPTEAISRLPAVELSLFDILMNEVVPRF